MKVEREGGLKMFLTDLIDEISATGRERRAGYIFAGLTSLSTLLFLVIWRVWLYGLMARTGEAIPRQALGSMLGVLSIWLGTSVVLNVLYAHERSNWKAILNRYELIVVDSGDYVY